MTQYVPKKDDTNKRLENLITALIKKFGNNVEVSRKEVNKLAKSNKKKFVTEGFITKNPDYRTTRGKVFITDSQDVVKAKKAYLKAKEAALNVLSDDEKNDAAKLAKRIMGTKVVKKKTPAKKSSRKVAPKRKTKAKKTTARKVAPKRKTPAKKRA